MQPIEKQTIMITGATSGLGRTLAERLARAGATVVAHGRDAERLARTRIELRFAVNHLAGYLLAHRLADRLAASAPSRIVQVASAGQLALDPDDPLIEQDYDGVTAYRRSKLAQVMTSYDLAAELVGTGVSVNAVHPATFMDTAMVREAGQSPTSSVEEGVEAVARLVTDPELDGVSGRYFHGTREAQPDPQADDPAVRSWLRGLSDALLERSRSGSR